MSSHIRPRLTAGEISSLIGVFPFVATTIVAFIWTSTWLQWKNGNFGGKTLRRNVTASLGTTISILTPRQIRSLFAHTTGEAIEMYCEGHGLSHQSALVKNEDGFPPATLHFVDCDMRGTDPILLYFQYVSFSTVRIWLVLTILQWRRLHRSVFVDEVSKITHLS